MARLQRRSMSAESMWRNFASCGTQVTNLRHIIGDHRLPLQLMDLEVVQRLVLFSSYLFRLAGLLHLQCRNICIEQLCFARRADRSDEHP